MKSVCIYIRSILDLQQCIISLLITEPEVTGDEVIRMTEWLKNNLWPLAQVGQYRKKTAIHRGQWIRRDWATDLATIVAVPPFT